MPRTNSTGGRHRRTRPPILRSLDRYQLVAAVIVLLGITVVALAFVLPAVVVVALGSVVGVGSMIAAGALGVTR